MRIKTCLNYKGTIQNMPVFKGYGGSPLAESALALKAISV
jgi:hypothetical protein